MAIWSEITNRSLEEIQDLKRLVEEGICDDGTQYPDLSYEDGIIETLEWLFEDGVHPYKGGKWKA